MPDPERDGRLPLSGRRQAARRRLALAAAVGLSLWMAIGGARAADPRLSRITPYGGQRGTELDLQIAGARLADAGEVLLYDPGIHPTQIKAEGAGKVNVHLAIDADCRLGPHAMRVRTASGISNLLTFSVGALPEVLEAEPNNEFNQPQGIPLGSTVNGLVANEDIDYYAVEAKKGERISVEIEGLRLGQTFFDPYLAILDKNRFLLAGCDDAPLVRQDAVAAAVVPEDGTYLIQVRESSFGGSNACRYRLHVGRFSRPLAAFPPGGKPGQPIEVRWLGDPQGQWTQEVSLPGSILADFGLFAEDDRGIAPSGNVVRLGELENVLEVDPNDTPAEATPFQTPAALVGAIDKPSDTDRFRFTSKKGQVLDVTVYARRLRSPLDSVLNIRRSGGASVSTNDDSGNPDSYIRFRAPEDGDYVITLTDHLGQGGPEYVYRVEIEPVQPRLQMRLPERSSFVDVTLSVPRGNRVAALVGAGRTDFAGDVKVQIHGLPPGISLQTATMAADRNTVPILLEAAADAQPAGSLADVVGRHEAAKRTIEGHLRQRTSLVRGQNNREVWNHYTDRMAVAVRPTFR